MLSVVVDYELTSQFMRTSASPAAESITTKRIACRRFAHSGSWFAAMPDGPSLLPKH
jgi:hypothetical protein